MPDQEIKSEIQINAGGILQPGVSPVSPPTLATLHAEAKSEYIAGAPNMMLASMLRSLPWWIDDLTASFGDDLYERMAKDPQVMMCILTLKLGALSSGIQLNRAVDPDHPDYALADEIATFIELNLNTMKPRPVRALFSLLDGLLLGNKLAEKIYRDAGKSELDELPTLKKRGVKPLFIDSLKTKPRRTYAFVCDPYLNVKGIVGLLPGRGMPMLIQSVITDPNQLDNILPPDKFMVFVNNPVDSDPRGTSVAYPAYTPWFSKQQAWGEWLKYMAQFASSQLAMELPEGAIKKPRYDANQNPILDVNGNVLYDDPASAARDALIAMRNGAVLVHGSGGKVYAIHPPGEGQAFQHIFQFCNDEISKAILGQTLSNNEGRSGRRAGNSMVHQDILGLFLQFTKSNIEAMLEEQFIAPLVAMNYGEDFLMLAPRVSLGDVEKQDFAAVANAIAALKSSGYIADEQLPIFDTLLGVPVRTVDPPNTDTSGEEDEMTRDDTGIPAAGGGPENDGNRETSGNTSNNGQGEPKNGRTRSDKRVQMSAIIAGINARMKGFEGRLEDVEEEVLRVG